MQQSEMWSENHNPMGNLYGILQPRNFEQKLTVFWGIRQYYEVNMLSINQPRIELVAIKGIQACGDILLDYE